MTIRGAQIALPVVGAAMAHAQLQLRDFSQNTTTFDETIGSKDGNPDNDVIRAAWRIDTLRIVEPGTWDSGDCIAKG